MTDKSATREGVLEKGPTDWEAVEKLYRAGVLSIREIAKQHGVTDTGIRKKAKALGWQRDLSDKVRERVRAELVRSEVRIPTREEQVRTEREIVEEAAATVVQVVRSHRQDIKAGRTVAALLMKQLFDVAGQREEFESVIDEVTAEDKSGERRAKLYRAISIGAHAATVRDLSNAMKNFVALERQAFAIGDAPEETPAAEGTGIEVLDKLSNLDAKWERVLGHAPTPQ